MMMMIVTCNINDGFVDSVTVSQHELYQDPETEGAACNSDIIHFIFYTCAFLNEILEPIVMVYLKYI